MLAVDEVLMLLLISWMMWVLLAILIMLMWTTSVLIILTLVMLLTLMFVVDCDVVDDVDAVRVGVAVIRSVRQQEHCNSTWDHCLPFDSDAVGLECRSWGFPNESSPVTWWIHGITTRTRWWSKFNGHWHGHTQRHWPASQHSANVLDRLSPEKLALTKTEKSFQWNGGRDVGAPKAMHDWGHRTWWRADCCSWRT